MAKKRASKVQTPATAGNVATFVPVGALTRSIAPFPDPKHGPPCHVCSALCCKYFALEIDRPVTPSDHDEIRWYLLHQNAVVWVEDGDWYLEVRNRCRHLQADNSCAIYETRPQICRDYGLPEKEGPCEYFTQDVDYDLFFESAEKFEAWTVVNLEKRARRLARRRELRKSQAASTEPRAAEA